MFLKKSVQIGGIPFDVIYDDGTVDFLTTLKALQLKSKELGFDKMTLEEIANEIDTARKDKKGMLNT